MKLNELIEQLEELKSRLGNADVKVVNVDTSVVGDVANICDDECVDADVLKQSTASDKTMRSVYLEVEF